MNEFQQIKDLIQTANDSNYHEVLDAISRICSAAILDEEYSRDIEDQFEVASAENEEA